MTRMLASGNTWYRAVPTIGSLEAIPTPSPLVELLLGRFCASLLFCRGLSGRSNRDGQNPPAQRLIWVRQALGEKGAAAKRVVARAANAGAKDPDWRHPAPLSGTE